MIKRSVLRLLSLVLDYGFKFSTKNRTISS
jgi:hypothetical protein